MQIEIRGMNYTGVVERSDQIWVSVLVNQLDQNFTKGETHTVRVFVANSVGTSNPQSTLLIVPCESCNSNVQCSCTFTLRQAFFLFFLSLTTQQSPLHASSCAVPPMTTPPPTELSATSIPVCCAGVQLSLANSAAGLTDVRVLVDGTLYPPNQVMRNGSFLYIMGLQAGTEYSLNITLTNIFGTVWVNTTVRSLLGELVLAI